MVSTVTGDSRSLLLLADADWVDDLVVVPGADAVLVLAELSAGAAEELRQVIFVHEGEQVSLVAPALDRDLSSRLLVKEALDHCPHTTEEHRRVHDEGLAHDLRVVV